MWQNHRFLQVFYTTAARPQRDRNATAPAPGTTTPPHRKTQAWVTRCSEKAKQKLCLHIGPKSYFDRGLFSKIHAILNQNLKKVKLTLESDSNLTPQNGVMFLSIIQNQSGNHMIYSLDYHVAEEHDNKLFAL